jgi:hypothetical protein
MKRALPLLFLCSCATLKAFGTGAIDCAAQGLTPSLVSAADAALNSNTWRSTLDSLLASVGTEAGECAIEAAVSAAEGQLAGVNYQTASASVFVSRHEECSRGYAYLEARGARFK